MQMRKMKEDDYREMYQLWQACGLSLGESDTEKEIHKFLDYNPDLCIALIKDSKKIGCVLGGYDGRRGIVHHLAVHPDFQKNGYGRLLMEKLEKEFEKLGVVKISFWVIKSNADVIGFYEKLNYHTRNDLETMSKFL